MWMHNGGLGGWKYIKRRLGERLADKWYLGVAGGTDSEWAFALFLDTLERMGFDPSSQPEGGFGPTVLRKAMLRTIDIINELIDNIPESLVHSENIDTRSLLNFALTDGHSIICTRYVGSSTDEAASLYYSSGTLWETREADPENRDYQMERSDKGADVVLVASEPLSFERGMFRQSMQNQVHGDVANKPYRKLGKRTYQLDLDYPQPNCSGTSYQGPVLRAGSPATPLYGFRQFEGLGRKREDVITRRCHSSHASHRDRESPTTCPEEVFGSHNTIIHPQPGPNNHRSRRTSKPDPASKR